MSDFDHLARWVEKKPLVLLSFSESYSEALQSSRAGFEKFTFAQPHSTFDGIKLPTVCLIELQEENESRCYIGVIKSKSAISTIDSRATLVTLRRLSISSFKSLIRLLPEKRFRTELEHRRPKRGSLSVLTSKLSSRIISILSSYPANRGALETVAFQLPRLRQINDSEWSQRNAIHAAVAAFGLGKNAIPEILEVRKDTSTTLNYIGSPHILEDNVIARDASVIPGFSLIEKDLTGRAVFVRDNERLEVFTANRGPLEEMFGVDLIYVNDILGNIVMVQYKMLETSGSDGDWIFRPDDQVEAEISRMSLPAVRDGMDDYRLNRSPFYFKFVKRKEMDEGHQSFLISLDHLMQILQSPASRGPKGGIRVSYRALRGTYLRESDIISLIRSGYIGAHRTETEFLKTLIMEVARGNRALVLAWQEKVS